MFRRNKPTLAGVIKAPPPPGFEADSPSEPLEGVPAHLQNSLFDWLAPIILAHYGEGWDKVSAMGGALPDHAAFVKLAERKLQIRLDVSNGERSAARDLGRRMDADQDVFLGVLALAVEHSRCGYSFQDEYEAMEQLDRMLREGGSVWEVAGNGDSDDPWHLRRRTTAEASAGIAAVVSAAGEVAEHMSAAWRAAFGQHPNPSEAYHRAVKAVEAAAIPVVHPTNPSAVLGHVIGELTAHPADWQVVWSRDAETTKLLGSRIAPLAVVISMLALLRANQTDRHGAGKSMPVTQEQAEVAVHLSLTLVQMFRSGAISHA